MPIVASKIRINGHVIIDLVNEGQIVRTEYKNLTVTSGYEILSKMILGTVVDEDRLAYIAVGTGGHVPGDVNTPVPPSLTDTHLEEETSRVGIYLRENPTANIIRFRTTIDKDSANGDITEAGLFAEGGIMFARVTFSAVNKVSPWYLIVTWEISLSEGPTS